MRTTWAEDAAPAARFRVVLPLLFLVVFGLAGCFNAPSPTPPVPDPIPAPPDPIPDPNPQPQPPQGDGWISPGLLTRVTTGMTQAALLDALGAPWRRVTVEGSPVLVWRLLEPLGAVAEVYMTPAGLVAGPPTVW